MSQAVMDMEQHGFFCRMRDCLSQNDLASMRKLLDEKKNGKPQFTIPDRFPNENGLHHCAHFNFKDTSIRFASMKLMLEYPGADAQHLLDIPTGFFNEEQPLWIVLSYSLWEQNKKSFRPAPTSPGKPEPSHTREDFINQVIQHGNLEESRWEQQNNEENKHVIEEKRHTETVGIARQANKIAIIALVLAVIAFFMQILPLF